jgi:hypothetical protein
MNSDRINQWLRLAANIGVLVGLILLIVELRQNLDTVRAQTRNEISTALISFLFEQATNPHLSEVIVRSNQGKELNETENAMYVARSEAIFRYWENVHYQYRKGMYDEVEYKNHLETMRVIVDRSPGLQRYWCVSENMFSRPFAAQMDKLIPVCETHGAEN